jgi:signal transduction histidine kinase
MLKSQAFPLRRLMKGRASAFDLKLRLSLRVAAISAACLLGVGIYALFDSDRATNRKAQRIAEIVARDISLQYNQARWINLPIERIPDLQRVAAPLMEPGLCIAFRDQSGAVRQRLCSGALADEVAAPAVFAALYRTVFRPGEPATSPAAARGEAVVSIDPATLIGQSWRETSRLLAVVGTALVGVSLLVYAALARALRPTRAIRAGLGELKANNLSARLPPFDLAELSAISEVFNALAGRLETALAERNALTRKLIAVQDEERLSLARELHDEFGQSLTAIAAQAAAAAHTAERDCPALLTECRSIARITADLMTTLRGSLVRLRPPDIDELGLTLCLESLVNSWNTLEKGRTRFELEISEGIDGLPPAVCAQLYRVAQEAITNAAKHARARLVSLRLEIKGAGLVLTIEDDGEGGGEDPVSKGGMGLLGMAERVAALGGRLRFERRGAPGAVLVATIPDVGRAS